MTFAGQSALVLLIPEADPIVGELRLAHDPAAAAGLGAHVTLLYPFVPASRIDRELIARLEQPFSRDEPVELRFDRTARFPGVCYLALAEPAPVVAMIRALAAAWPEYPLYGGQFSDVVPHLTVAHGDDPVLDAADRALAGALPLVVRVTFASLLVADDDGRWREHTRFALAVG